MAALATERLQALADWIADSSVTRTTPLGDKTLVGPWAVIVPADFEAAPDAEFAPEALPLYVQPEQADGVYLPPIDRAGPPSQGHMGDRLAHLLWRIQDGTLPACVIIGLTDAAEPILAAVERAGADGVDLTAFPLLCAPLWALTADQRAEVTAKLPLLP